MNRKNIYVVQPSLPPLNEYVEQLKDIWESGIMTHQGPKHELLKKELKKVLEVECLTLFANGHLALELGLGAMDLTGEVITTPFTFGSTVQAILRNGLTPVFCDIREDDFTIDCDQIEELITDKTTAIVPVHVYGNLCDVERLDEIARRNNLKVVYDAAHAFGETFKGKSVACFGDASMFSFHATKVFNTVEGGCLTYHNKKMEERLDAAKQFGQIVGTEEVPYEGTNAKMTEVSAAMGLCNLPYLKKYIDKRREIAELYRFYLDKIDGIYLPPLKEDVKSNYAYFPVLFRDEILGFSRDKVLEKLAEHHIYAKKYFYPLCSDFEIVRKKEIKAHVPRADYISRRILTLPLHSELSREDAIFICELIRDMVPDH